MSQMTPQEIVHELDKHIIGQNLAKRAVAIALRNRWRRQQISDPLRQEITPKNILMIGPTGVGKTEIARRLAKLADAPFIKIEATKFTEVGYVGRDVPILKHVIGLPGQRVCRDGAAITVDGRHLGEARERDSQGRDLPVWQGCRTIVEGEVFLMNPAVSDSFDGRYFGPFPTSAVIGRASPLFTDEGGDGRLVWHAPER